METCRTLSDVSFSAVTPERSDVKTPKEGFEFMSHPLFTFRPSQNPSASHATAQPLVLKPQLGEEGTVLNE